MFTSLLQFFDALWKTGLGIFQTIWDWTKFAYVWIIGLVLAFLTIGGRVTDFVWSQVQVIFGIITGANMPNGNLVGSATGNLLNIANIFFPVAEMFTLMTALTVTMLSMMLYRLIKSWIPTFA
jgi:hypothetical protein